jgi:starch synthase
MFPFLFPFLFPFSGRQPDIIHCHDWSTAMATKFYWSDYHHNGLSNPRCVFTIHNLEFGQAKASIYC